MTRESSFALTWRKFFRNWERRRTARFISSLPREVRKDIGWPGNREYLQRDECGLCG